MELEYDAPNIAPAGLSYYSTENSVDDEIPIDAEEEFSLVAHVHAIDCGLGWIRLTVHSNGDSITYYKNINVDISDLISGIYFLSVSDGTGTKPVVKQVFIK
jgi:hypothetical protein